jgi:GntR family transcriptional regulator
MPDQGPRGGMRRRFLDLKRQRAPAEIARLLALDIGESVLQLRRLLLSGETPVVLDDIWLPARPFKGLTAERLTAWRGPMYGLFEAEFGVRMVRAEEKIRAVAAGTVDAELLAVAPGAPLLLVERLSMTYADRPVELRRGLYRTESHYYRNELS